MAPLLNTLISRIVLGQTKKSQPDLPRPASITFSEGDFPGGHQHHEGYPSQPSSLGGSPTQGPQSAGLFGNSSAQGSTGQPLTHGNSATDSQAQPDSADLEAQFTQNLAVQGNAGVAAKSKENSRPEGRQQGQDASSAPLQDSSPQSQSTFAGPDAAPSTSDEHHSRFGAHAYNGGKDDSDAAAAAVAGPTSDASQSHLSSATNNNNTDRVAQRNVSGTDSSASSASNSAGLSHEAQLSTTDQDSFAELVQGTEQFLGMLGARNIS